MSAKKPQTDHARALAAFQGKWITAQEYRKCLRGSAWISGRGMYVFGVWRPSLVYFPNRGKVRP